MNRRFVRYIAQHHWGMLATFIALGGTAYAASELPPNSVGTRQLQRHAVTLSKISTGTQNQLRGHTGRAGRIGPAGPTGPSDGYYSASPLIITAYPDSRGASVTVPPGDYIATGGCTASQGAPTGQSVSMLTFGTADAILLATAPGQQLPSPPYADQPGAFSSTASVPNEGYNGAGHNGSNEQEGAASLSNSGGFSLPKGGTITEVCQDDNAVPAGGAFGGTVVSHLNFTGYYLTAIRVGALHGTGP